MAAWPSALGDPEFSGFEDIPRPNIVEAPIALGTPKRRRRFTGSLRQISFSNTWTLANYRTFLAFYKDDLEDGVLPFTMNDGIKNESSAKWLIESFTSAHVGPGAIQATITMVRIE